MSLLAGPPSSKQSAQGALFGMPERKRSGKTSSNRGALKTTGLIKVGWMLGGEEIGLLTLNLKNPIGRGLEPGKSGI